MFVQQFIENVVDGDKRILIIDGIVLGSFLRIPKKNSILSGTVHGSALKLSQLTPREEKICEKVIKFLKEKDIYFAGLDVIDGYLTEINFTSPSGISILSELTKIDYGIVAWNLIEKIYERKIKINYLEV